MGPSVQQNLRNLIEDAATTKKIPFQRLAASKWTGTDTDAFAYTQNGIASALISLPLRYMHTTVEMVEKHDVEQTIKLIYEVVCAIKSGHDFTYIKSKKLPTLKQNKAK